MDFYLIFALVIVIAIEVVVYKRHIGGFAPTALVADVVEALLIGQICAGWFGLVAWHAALLAGIVFFVLAYFTEALGIYDRWR